MATPSGASRRIFVAIAVALSLGMLLENPSSTASEKTITLCPMVAGQDPVTGLPLDPTTPSHTVTYFPNGGSGSTGPETKAQGFPTALFNNSFTNPGYSFLRWDTKPTGDGVAFWAGWPNSPTCFYFMTDLSVYAIWVTSYTVTFEGNGGSGSLQPQITWLPTNLSPNDFKKPGYYFSRWDTKPTGDGVPYTDKSEYSFNANLTLYAIWSIFRKSKNQ